MKVFYILSNIDSQQYKGNNVKLQIKNNKCR